MDYTPFVRGIFESRARRPEKWVRQAGEVQERVLRSLLRRASMTWVGFKYDFNAIAKSDDVIGRYRRSVPPVEYEDIRETVMRMIRGEKSVLWPGVCRDYAQSSGTSGGNNDVRLYINGAISGMASLSEMDIRPSQFKPVLNYIGRSQFATDPMLNGLIDDFRIYNHTLSAEQIAQAMNGETVRIDSIPDNTDVRIISTEYYNIQGMPLNEIQPEGLTIVRTVYNDGSVVVKKIIK